MEPSTQNRERRGRDLTDERGEPIRQIGEVLRAAPTVGARGIAASARGVEVLGPPTDPDGLLGAEQAAAGRERVR
jgi:hypothetical protein